MLSPTHKTFKPYNELLSFESLPFVTVNVVVVPSVKYIVYVSTKPSAFVSLILDIPFPVSP